MQLNMQSSDSLEVPLRMTFERFGTVIGMTGNLELVRLHGQTYSVKMDRFDPMMSK
jgi:hypothetical protein